MSNENPSFGVETFQGPQGLPTFADVIQAAKEGYAARISQGTLTVHITDASFLERLRAEGYDVAQSSFSGLKKSITNSLPRHPLLLIAALARCFDLNSAEIKALVDAAIQDTFVKRWEGSEGTGRISEFLHSASPKADFKGTVVAMSKGVRLREVSNLRNREWFYALKGKVRTKEDEDRWKADWTLLSGNS